MKTCKSLLTLIFLCLLSGLTSATNAQQNYSNVIAFGDSLSDTGNLSSVTIPFPYPFYQNRVSDGPLALDYFTESLGYDASASRHLSVAPDGYNYAVAGGNILGSDPEDLQPQVISYLSRENNAADPLALYVVIMGGNDIRGVRSIPSSETANTEIELIVDQLITQLTRLSDAGAQHFFIANVANIGRIPETLQLGETISQQAQTYSQNYNAVLATRLNSFRQQTGTTVTLFDLYAALEQIIDNATDLGFTYTEEGCFVDFDFHPGCLLGFGFNNFVFFDNLHPTNATNQIVAQAMIDKLNQVDSEANPLVFPIGAIMLLLNE